MTNDRDRSIEELLRRSLPARGGEGACLDAETLAAWVDGGLNASALALAESHLSACPRCQAMLAAIGRSAPSAPEPERWWRRDWSLGWLVPLTAGAAAIALWIAVPARAPRVEPPAPAFPQKAEVQPQPAASPSPGTSMPVDRVAPAPATEADKLQGRGLQVGRETQQAGRPAEAQVDRQDQPRAARQAPVDADVRAKEEARAEAGRRSNESAGQLANSARAVPPAAPAQSAEPAAARDRFTTAAFQSAMTARDIVSPDARIRWRIGASGSVQYSTNAGASWESLASGVTEDLTAGAAPSATVCWIVGRAGTILRTTDGRRWQRVASPAAVDLTAVQASDASTASVTTADGRVFRTIDGGATWN